ncbi:MAG: hypothetical protein EOP06_07590 [Proteobacteria bacterium]|nr:MAG: hypothetical protein EOP06_07590 [Pseudomonadota bacterium]
MLERFVKGDALLHERDLKELSFGGQRPAMRGYWEIRSQGRMEETRLFGFFARPGALVGTGFEGKGRLLSGDDYKARRAACGKIWDALLPGCRWIQDPWPVETKDHMYSYLNRVEDD